MKICGLDFPDKYLKKHYMKRKNEGFVKNKEEYISIIKETIKNADKFYIVRQFTDCKDKLIFYFNNWSVWILIEKERIITTFYVKEENMDIFFKKRKIFYGLSDDCDKETYIEVNKNENSEYTRIIKAIQNRC